MFGLGVQEILIILIVAGLIFGARKLPEIGAGLGQGIKNFKKSLREDESKKGDETKKIESGNQSSPEENSKTNNPS